MAGTLAAAFVMAGALVVITLQQSARDAAREAAAVRVAEEARGRMTHPPTCNWALHQGNTYACFLSRMHPLFLNQVVANSYKYKSLTGALLL